MCKNRGPRGYFINVMNEHAHRAIEILRQNVAQYATRMHRPPRDGLYDAVADVETLTRAWQHVRRSRAPGIDGQSVVSFEAHWAENMAELAAELRERRYHPRPLRQYLRPRPEGPARPISLLALRDRVVQRAVLDVTRSRFSAAASPAAFGTLPGRGVGEAIARAEAARYRGLPWVVRADIHAFFEQVSHERILNAFRSLTGDPALTGLIEEYLAIGILADRERAETIPELPSAPVDSHHPVDWKGFAEALPSWTAAWEIVEPHAVALAPAAAAFGPRLLRKVRPGVMPAAGGAALALVAVAVAARIRTQTGRLAEHAVRGTPQGSPLSPLLATAVLTPFDAALDRQPRVLVRYVDDILVLCPSEAEALAAQRLVERELARIDLQCNATKWLVQPYDAGFTFLGTELPQLAPALPATGLRATLESAFRRSGYWRARLTTARRARAAPHPAP
jgi:RNA-directed DNA polymerase